MRLSSSMKGGFHGGVRTQRLSLTIVAFVCMTFLLWSWEKTPTLTSSLLPQNELLSPDILVSAPFRSSIDRNGREDISTVTERETPYEQDEGYFNSADQVDSVKRFSENNAIQMNATAIPDVYDRDTAVVTEKQMPDVHREQGFVVVAPVDHLEIATSKRETIATPVSKKACNYGQGKWVIDNRRPLYSGFGCKEWLSEMWACRLTQRTDFAYEKLRWQPKDCNMEDFSASKFFLRMQDKTLAFIGDSLGRQQFQSLMCMITGGEERPDVINVGKEYGLVKPRGAVRPDGWAYRFPSSNTTILYYWSASLCDLEPLDLSNPATEYAMHLDRPPAFLSRFIPKIDVLVLNTGHHWNRGKLTANRWIMYVGGVPNTDRKIATIGGAKNFTVHSIVSWVNLQIPKYPGLQAFLRSISPRHFYNGDWNTGGTCDNTIPLAGGREVLQEESIDPVAAGAVKGTRVKLLDITALSQLRDEGHISRYSIRAAPGMQDCLHWCLPGVPDTWNEVLVAQIESGKAGGVASSYHVPRGNR